MPIYAYRCSSCGHAQDVLRKVSDPPLTICPACGAPTFVKQVTAAGFQLKGSGWYVTDFRDGSSKKAAAKGASDDAAAKEAAPAASAGESSSASTGEAASAPAKPAAAPAAPASAPAAAPSPAPSEKGRT